MVTGAGLALAAAIGAQITIAGWSTAIAVYTVAAMCERRTSLAVLALLAPYMVGHFGRETILTRWR